MRKSIYIYCAVTIFMGSLCPTILPKDQPKKNQSVVSITKVESESTDSFSIISIHLSTSPNWKNVKLENHKSFLQVRLPDTLVPDTGSFYDTESRLVSKVGVYQLNQKEAIVRFFVSQDAGQIKKSADVQLLNTRLILTIDHSALDKKTEALASSPKSKTNLRDDPAKKKMAKDYLSEASHTQSPIDLGDPLIILTLISLVFLLSLITTLTVKRYVRNRRLLALAGGAPVLEQISTLMLTPKQKLSLVSVGGQKLLLSVSNENVSLLSVLETAPQEITSSILPQESAPLLMRKPENIATTQKRAESSKKAASRKVGRPQKSQSTAGKGHKREVSQSSASPSQAAATPHRGTVNYTIDEGGIKNNRKDSKTENVDDITKIIREKLKNLPSLG